MEFSFTPEEQKVLEEVRAFLKSETTLELLAETDPTKAEMVKLRYYVGMTVATMANFSS